MDANILNHYLEFSMYTDPGLYAEKLKRDLPNDVREIGLLVRKSIIHRSTLAEGNTGTNADLRFGDMTQVPWFRQPEDDVLPTAVAMIAELYRRDSRGFVMDRAPQDKLVLTCRFTAILTASILKAKGIPARVVSGHASYFDNGPLGDMSTDHWVNEYWNEKEQRWVCIDVDGSLSLQKQFDPYDVPEGTFDFPADSWLAVRSGKIKGEHFHNAKPESGLIVVLWSLISDFHCMMNDEIIYTHTSLYGSDERFAKLTTEELSKIDHLATLMQNPDENFDTLTSIWDTDRELRLLVGGLL